MVWCVDRGYRLPGAGRSVGLLSSCRPIRLSDGSIALRKARNGAAGPARLAVTAMLGTAPWWAPALGSATGWPMAEGSAVAFPSATGLEMAWGLATVPR